MTVSHRVTLDWKLYDRRGKKQFILILDESHHFLSYLKKKKKDLIRFDQ